VIAIIALLMIARPASASAPAEAPDSKVQWSWTVTIPQTNESLIFQSRTDGFELPSGVKLKSVCEDEINKVFVYEVYRQDGTKVEGVYLRWSWHEGSGWQICLQTPKTMDVVYKEFAPT
jgi:hypothetical protein